VSAYFLTVERSNAQPYALIHPSQTWVQKMWPCQPERQMWTAEKFSIREKRKAIRQEEIRSTGSVATDVADIWMHPATATAQGMLELQ